MPGLAVFQVVADKGRKTIQFTKRMFLQIQSQIGLARFFRGTMAKEAFAGKDWSHVAIEGNGFRRCHSMASKEKGNKDREFHLFQV